MKSKNLFLGVFFILAAILIILQQLGYLVGINLTSLVITLILVPVIVKSITHRHFAGILFPAAIIGILYADQLGIQKFVPWPILGVAFFLSIGLSLIFPQHKKWECHTNRKECDKAEGFAEIIDGPEESEVNLYTRFGASVKYINSENLEKVKLDCSFGAMKVYFDNSKITGEEAVVNINVDFSGVELYIPKDWKVENRIDAMLGGIDEKGFNKQINENSKKLILKGKCSFSGIEIIYL